MNNNNSLKYGTTLPFFSVDLLLKHLLEGTGGEFSFC